MSAAACDVWIWGAKARGSVNAVENLLMAREIDKDSEEGKRWLEQAGVFVGTMTRELDKLLDNLPVYP